MVSSLGNGIEAFRAVPAAIYAFLSHPLSFSEAVRYAISLGGDTDTIASMTGALSGAYLGDSAIRLAGGKMLKEPFASADWPMICWSWLSGDTSKGS